MLFTILQQELICWRFNLYQQVSIIDRNMVKSQVVLCVLCPIGISCGCYPQKVALVCAYAFVHIIRIPLEIKMVTWGSPLKCK